MRILAAKAAILERNFNDAESGAKMVDLDAQVSSVNEQNVAYITILIGANDLCTRTVAGMTSVDDFRSQFDHAIAALSAGSPRARIYVVSVPNAYRLWLVLKDNLFVRLAWRMFDVCQSLLEDPRSTDPEDVARRRSVRQRNIAFSTELAEVCALYIHCRFDGRAVFEDPFTAKDVSRRDYFHPSPEGQRGLAQVTWAATFDFTDQLPRRPRPRRLQSRAAPWCPWTPPTTSAWPAWSTGSTSGPGSVTPTLLSSPPEATSGSGLST